MLDHVFVDAIGALRDSLEAALLERVAFEEALKSDVLLGDLTWETAYGVPGEGSPPRVRADITLDWPTWSQTAYRSWYIGEPPAEPASITISVVLGLHNLVERPEPSLVLEYVPEQAPSIGEVALVRSGPIVQTVFGHDLENLGNSLEVAFEGSYELSEDCLEDGALLDRDFTAVGGWITSALVRLGDLDLASHPPFDKEA